MKNFIDKKTEFHLIKKISKEWENVQEPTKSQIESIFELDKSKEYYEGLLAGFSSALSYKRDFRPELNANQLEEIYSILVSYTSKVLKEKIEDEESE